MKVVNYLLVMLFSFLASNVPAHDMMFLFGRGSIGTIDFKLNNDDSEWLKSNKPAINIGITLPENPPFDLISEGDHRSYEGLSADYISLLADMLQASINLTVYNSRLEAINDIKNGKIDLLTTSNRFEEFHGLVLSHPYIKDMPTLYISEASAQSKKSILLLWPMIIYRIERFMRYILMLLLFTIHHDKKPSQQQSLARLMLSLLISFQPTILLITHLPSVLS
ncbi:hypothetical protein ACSZME_15020 [Aeromonas dhakensis]